MRDSEDGVLLLRVLEVMKTGYVRHRTMGWWDQTIKGIEMLIDQRIDMLIIIQSGTKLSTIPLGVCRSEEGEPWDGTDQTILFQVVVSLL